MIVRSPREGLGAVVLICPPGTYGAQDDTDLLIRSLGPAGVAGRRVLDMCSGPGTVALAAARAGAVSVTAVELSRRSAWAARVNARTQGLPVEVRRGDLFTPVTGRRFDVIVANPPYVPSDSARLPRHGKARCWDGGRDGRTVLDRLCAGLPRHLAVGGRAVLVHSAVCDAELTVRRLGAAGLDAAVTARARVPFGPVMRSRAAMLEARGYLAAGCRTEEIVAVEATAAGTRTGGAR